MTHRTLHNNTNFSIYLFIALVLLTVYLWPVLSGAPIYVETFDNLDLVVPQAKILAQSGKIFADSNATIPNMMNGLPRITYGSEWNILFWIYYFFPPETAFKINFFLMHTTAFVSMYILLKRYFTYDGTHRHLIIVSAAFVFAILPFYTGAGLTTSVLPLLLYILLNIRNHSEKKYEWLLLIFIPFYTSLILLYIFVLAYLWLFFIFDTLFITRHFHKKLFIALVLLTTLYILSEYRLFYAMLIEPLFVSHRTEFNSYFAASFREAHYFALRFFLDGWWQHQRSLLMPWLLPVILTAMGLSIVKYKFGHRESILFGILIGLSIYANLWHDPLTNRYTLLWIFVFSLLTIEKAEKPFKILGWLVLIQVLLAVYNGLTLYNGLAFLKEWFPILNQFNISRAAFIQPIIWYVALAYTLAVYYRYMKYVTPFLVLLLSFQFYYALQVRRVSLEPHFKYMTYKGYYAPQLFEQIKQDLHLTPRTIQTTRFVSYALEPAIALYNGLYTVDGYTTNYPLSYKHAFEQVQKKECFNMMPGNKKMYEEWGSKVYLLCIESRPENYHSLQDSWIKKYPFYASTEKLCNIGTDYVLSGVKLKLKSDSQLKLIKDYHNADTPWHIWVYKLSCSPSS